MKTGFIDKLISRLGRVRPEEAKAHLLRVVKEKGFLETIFNAIQEGIVVTDPGGRIVYLNDASCEFFGLQGRDSLGKLISEQVRGLDWPALSASADLVSRDMEVFYPAHRFLNFYVVPLLLEDVDDSPTHKADPHEQGYVGYAMIVRDLTETRQATQATIEDERFNALTMLAAGVAHEIGNPLNSLTIHLQLMERRLRKLPPDQRGDLDDSVRVAREEIRRLDFIVSQFLRAIRPGAVATQPADVNAVLAESVSFLSAEIADRDILVELETAKTLPSLELDRDQMKQAFYNVIRNSFQAMKTGGILRITTKLEPDYVAVSFSDTGGGIAPREHGQGVRPVFHHQEQRQRPGPAHRAADRARARRGDRAAQRHRPGPDGGHPPTPRRPPRADARIQRGRGGELAAKRHETMSKNLPQKICAQCGRPFDWRKKWERCWDEVRYCSERLQGRGQTPETPRQPMKNSSSLHRCVTLCFVAGLLCAQAGCRRAPQTAAELRDRLPRQWQGDIKIQGEQRGSRIGIELRELTVRTEHVLEFNRIRWQAFAGNETLAQEEAAIRGTITLPGGEIRLDEEGTQAGEGLNPASFHGTLAPDLQSAEASWTGAGGEAATLKLRAQVP